MKRNQLAALKKYVKERCYCACCGTWKKCCPDCTFDIDRPPEYEKMMLAREAYWGKEKL